MDRIKNLLYMAQKICYPETDKLELLAFYAPQIFTGGASAPPLNPSGGATVRDFVSTFSTQYTSSSQSDVKEFVLVDQYKTVLGRQNVQKEIDNVPDEEKKVVNVPAGSSSAVPMVEEMPRIAQDSDDDMSDVSPLPSSQNCLPRDSHPNEKINESGTVVLSDSKTVQDIDSDPGSDSEDETFGYIVKENLENVVRKIHSLLKTNGECIAKLDRYKHRTAATMSQWNSREKEQQRLKQLLRDLVTAVNKANEYLHHFGLVSMNLKVNNLFVKFGCNCWASQSCVHGSSGLTVVIRNSESAYSVDSLVDGITSSKALEWLDHMHKYKRAEQFYDDLDVVIIVVKLLTKFSDNQSCKKELRVWMSNTHFTDPPVEAVKQLFEECGVAQNDIIKMIDYLKVAAVRYDRLHGEHEV